MLFYKRSSCPQGPTPSGWRHGSPPESQPNARAKCRKLNSSEESTASSQFTGSISIDITGRHSCQGSYARPPNHRSKSLDAVRQYDALSSHGMQSWHPVPDQASQPYPQRAALPQELAPKHFLALLAIFVGRMTHEVMRLVWVQKGANGRGRGGACSRLGMGSLEQSRLLPFPLAFITFIERRILVFYGT